MRSDPAQPFTATPAAPAAAHNRFLDFVRTVAVIRVLAWHTYGFAWLSYLVASMPAMFFVAGSLMAHSLDRYGAWHVYYSRFRRLLIPLWVLGAVAMAIMISHAAIRPGPGESVAWYQPLFWIFPIWDPQGSDWGVTWWAVLWYMRGITWLILLSPLLHWLFRRLSFAVLGIPLGLLAFFEYQGRTGHPVRWQFEDAALFGFFWLLGFCYNDGLLQRTTMRIRLGATVVFAAAAAVWATTQPVPAMVVNASYPAHLFVGLAWLAAALTLERPIVAFAAWNLPARFIGWVNDRAYTIYLWHTAGLFAMYEILWAEAHPAWLRNLFAFPIVLLVTFSCMIAFGWIEDFAARREVHLAPHSVAGRSRARGPARARWAMPALAGAGVVALFGAVLMDVFTTRDPGADVASAVPPSGVGLAIRAERAQILDAPPTRAAAPASAATQAAPAVTTAELQSLIESWASETGVPGAVVGIRRGDGAAWAGATGSDPASDGPLGTGTLYPIASVTKTFTSALILQLAEEGKLSLDDKASRYVPNLGHSSEITVRQLIQHTSGLMATDAVAPAAALAAASAAPLAFTPGTGFLYSSPGYFMLGLVIEKVTGESYTDALHDVLLDPLGLANTYMDEELAPLAYSTHPVVSPALQSSSGVLRSSSGLRSSSTPSFEYRGILWSSAGLESTVGDLTTWALALWDGTTVVSTETRDAMTTFLGPEFQYAGLATYPFCPCWRDDSGRLVGERWGHYGKFGVLEYDPRDRVALAIYTTGTSLDEHLIGAYDELSRRIRELVRGREIAVSSP